MVTDKNATHSMSKVRINELARELEVKPGEILRVLPELGVADKKTHSSSLEDDVVEEVAVTVVHELAHHFGIDDDRLAELGWD